MSTFIHRDVPAPRPGTRHDATNSQLLIFLLTVIAMTLLFLIWRRASSLKSVVQHRLRTLTSSDGAIHLPAEDGPPAEIFNEDEDLDADDGPLPERHDEASRNANQRDSEQVLTS